ncbi:hypothetical protein BDR05DRAFT_582234 [Suillus weaverae]|nr:hypothetical protein BDR05DRAFT_582234 [Suillus weaverae]
MLRSPTKGVPLLLDGLWNQFNIGVISETKEQERSDDAWSLDRGVEVELRWSSDRRVTRIASAGSTISSLHMLDMDCKMDLGYTTSA